MVSNYAPLSTMSYAAMPLISAGGRAYLPVDSNQFVYSHFQYVSGVPREEHQIGISIDKLQILNTLIDQLVKMKDIDSQDRVLFVTAKQSDNLDSMIAYVGEKVHSEIELNKNTVYAPVAPEPAFLFSFTI